MTRQTPPPNIDFDKVARALVHTGDHLGLARRYLAVSGRRRVLVTYYERFRAELRRDHPLALIGFRPPLSAAGQPPDVLEVAAAMNTPQCPIALERDDKGRHRGTSIEDVADQLHQVFPTEQFSPRAVLGFYRTWMVPTDQRLAGHGKRAGRMPKRMLDVALELETLQKCMLDALREPEGVARFTCTVLAVNLQIALELCATKDAKRNRKVVLGFDGTHLCLDGKSRFAASSGCGRGLAVVRRSHLYELIEAGGECVTIEAQEQRWAGKTDGAPGQFPFPYYAKKEKA